jgi:hypothetical protein
MPFQHQTLAGGKWFTMTLAQQLGNVGSDYERALRWQNKRRRLFTGAVTRTLELLDLTLADRRWQGPRRREIARLRDEVCRELLGENINGVSARQLQRYFLSMAALARKT